MLDTAIRTLQCLEAFHTTCCYGIQKSREGKEKQKLLRKDGDPRVRELGRAIDDDFKTIRESYGMHSSLL
jgi:hypothetical protein